MFVLLVILLLRTTQGVSSLKLREFSVPAVVMRGDAVRLNCSYDLERDKLYSIKWHKNNVEFYRYLPEDTPPGQKYELAGIHLDLSRSSEGNIYMSKTDVNSEGTYTCEVSTEAPFFQTVKGEREMRIYVNPTSPPVIRSRKQHFFSGEMVNVSCVSAPSRPAAILKWWINDREAKDEYLRGPFKEESADGLFTSILILTFRVSSSHFWGGRMILICEAIISQGHTLRSEEILIYNKSRLPHRTIFSDYEKQKEAPVIRGERSKYEIGDLVDINCTAAKSQPPAELHWYINDKEAKPEFLIPHASVFYEDGMVSSVLGLRFYVKHRHYQKDEMRLRCTATLSEIMKMTSAPLEADISERQMSDLHVDVNAGAVASGCLQKYREFSLWWTLILIFFISRTNILRYLNWL
ncbi:uncharacterized protein LOC129217610 [Uloborus diversus]|uniref:uncharacterized protein LOC129217610 n=1 Tax=Uloborus diversus TaxID=327109 RepID=UPI002408F7EE|nr:uncharacterized protein LOC129217610 [Uloborus diversus]